MLGYSLTQTLMIMSITSLVACASIPSWHQFWQEKQVKNQAQQISHLIQLAKNFAITRHTETVLCPSQSGSSCQGQWQQGILLFYDNNHDHQRENSEKIIKYQPMSTNINLSLKAFPSNRYLAFSPLGFMTVNNGSFYLRHQGQERQLSLSQTGLVKIIQS